MAGTIIARKGVRGTTYRLKYESAPRDGGKRTTAYFTMPKGSTKKQAETELARRVVAVNQGGHIDASSITVGEYLLKWLEGHQGRVAQSTLEQYSSSIRAQIIPHLGHMKLQALRPQHVADWHATMQKHGISGQAIHGVLTTALKHACRHELLARNVAALVGPPPRLSEPTKRFLTPEQTATILERTEGTELYPAICLALGTGMRCGEICGLRWGKLDLDGGTVTVDASVSATTKLGRTLKGPKTAAGVRSLSIPPELTTVMRQWWIRLTEARLSRGLGRPGPDDLVFPQKDRMSPQAPETMSAGWIAMIKERGLPKVPFHSFRHTHASYLIDAGIDPVEVSRRLGHSSPAITMKVYSHAFRTVRKDERAAAAIAAVFRSKEPSKAV
jgi:integrase